MSHVEKTDAEIRESAEEKKTAALEEAAKKPEQKDPRLQRKYTFPFSYKNQRGDLYTGTFTNEILTIGEKMDVGALESQFNGGQPYDSIEPMTQVINRGIAHMTYSLKTRANQSPKGWADNLRKLDDGDLIVALFVEVSGHENFFRGLIKEEASSEGPEGDAPADS